MFIPSLETFDAQSADYCEFALPHGAARIAIEAGVGAPWHRLVGEGRRMIGIDRFGESAPAGTLFELFGLIVVDVAQDVRQLAARSPMGAT